MNDKKFIKPVLKRKSVTFARKLHDMKKHLHFDSDYMRGAHPEILKRLVETNMEQTPGYGTDGYTDHAKHLIKEACGLPEAEVYLLVGGTQTNSTVIDGLLYRHEGVLAAETAHINVHESGAIEYTGHKVLTLPSHQGKLLAKEVRDYLTSFYADDTYEHMVSPGMVYISYPTEYGTLYTRDELAELHEICHEYNIPLFIDGARLGYGLAADKSVTLKDIASLCDVFYIGGTKVGALFGEAVVFGRRGMVKHPVALIKLHGALLAKGRLLGVQFETLFTGDMYVDIAGNAISRAMELKNGFVKHGYVPYIDSPTNQQFFKLPNEVVDKLMEIATFEYWGPRGETESVVRFVTDWATTAEDVESLLSAL